MLILTEQDILSLFPLPESLPSAMEAIVKVHLEMDQGRVSVPPRLHMDYPPNSGRGRFMRVLTAMVPSANAAMARVYGSARDYTGPKPKEAQAVLLYEFESMGLLALVSFDQVQVVRTAAPTALATRYLARPDAHRVAILGSGKHAPGQLMAVAAVRPVNSARVYSPNREHREAFAASMRAQLGIDVQAVATAEEAVADADVICAATITREPVVRWEWLKPGVHVNSMATNEIDEETVQRARVVVSTREQVLYDAPPRQPFATMLKDGKVTEDHFGCELTDLLTGKDPGRRSEDEVTVFASAGHALWDAAIVAEAYRLARERGIGQEVKLA